MLDPIDGQLTSELWWWWSGEQGFLAEGLQRTSAGLGSVIIDSQPLTVAVLASLLFGESLSALGYAGLLLGIAGLLLLEIPQASLEAFLQNPGVHEHPSPDTVAIGTQHSWHVWDCILVDSGGGDGTAG